MIMQSATCMPHPGGLSSGGRTSSSVLPMMSRAIVQLPPDEHVSGYLLVSNILGCFSIFKKDVIQSTEELNMSL